MIKRCKFSVIALKVYTGTKNAGEDNVQIHICDNYRIALNVKHELEERDDIVKVFVIRGEVEKTPPIRRGE
jgi:hypothetical protein